MLNALYFSWLNWQEERGKNDVEWRKGQEGPKRRIKEV